MSNHETEWRRLARKLTRFLNAAWWIDRFAPLLVVTSFAGAIAVLLLRDAQAELPLPVSLAVIGGILALLALVAWLLARSRFVGLDDAFVRLEKHLRLHNALSTASQGIGPWPSVPLREKTDAGFAWRWSRLLAPLALSLGLVAAAFIVPLRPLTAGDRPEPEEPLALKDMESWLAELAENKAADETDLERAAEKVSELRGQPKEDWYSHSSMEATDTLKEQLGKSIRRLGKNASTAERSIGALRAHSSHLSKSNRQRLVSEYSEALQGMQSGEIRPNAALLKSLENIDLSSLNSLSQAQMQQLSDALKNTSGACSSCLGGMQAPAGWRNDSDLLSGSPGSPGRRFPEGGPIKRGPGEAPISLSAKASDLGTRSLEGVASKDYSRATFGDTLAIGESEHSVDKSKAGARSAGAIRSPAKGGERIWHESLLPSEREVLKRYFK